MASERQMQANRLNAQKSTGPRTENGKLAVRHNALKHGLLSRDLLLSDEDAGEFRELCERLRARLQPQGELEELLADRVATAAWRLRRVMRVESELFEKGRYDYTKTDLGPGHAFQMDSLGHNGNAFSKLSRYETAVERSLFKALHELQRLQATRKGEGEPLPVAPDVTGDAPDAGRAA